MAHWSAPDRHTPSAAPAVCRILCDVRRPLTPSSRLCQSRRRPAEPSHNGGSLGRLTVDNALVGPGGDPADFLGALHHGLQARDPQWAVRGPRPVQDFQVHRRLQRLHDVGAIGILQLCRHVHGPLYSEDVAARQKERDPLVASHGDPADDAVFQCLAVDAVHAHRWVQLRSLIDLHDLAHVHAADLPTLLDQEIVRQHNFLHDLVVDADDPHEVLLGDKAGLAASLALRGLEQGVHLAFLDVTRVLLEESEDVLLGDLAVRRDRRVETLRFPVLGLDADAHLGGDLHARALVLRKGLLMSDQLGGRELVQRLCEALGMLLGFAVDGHQVLVDLHFELRGLVGLNEDLLDLALHLGQNALGVLQGILRGLALLLQLGGLHVHAILGQLVALALVGVNLVHHRFQRLHEPLHLPLELLGPLVDVGLPCLGLLLLPRLPLDARGALGLAHLLVARDAHGGPQQLEVAQGQALLLAEELPADALKVLLRDVELVLLLGVPYHLLAVQELVAVLVVLCEQGGLLLVLLRRSEFPRDLLLVVLGGLQRVRRLARGHLDARLIAGNGL
mmetsp:Transcript_22449/g.57181  ORF Transcript_22449/g.57181 Transcript_22449/m.57181 type:complete len:562 (-) Transcript_22449:1277-2962(-)